MSLSFQVEPYSNIRDEAQRITIEHYEEIALFKDKMALEPDFERYAALEKNGSLCVITARMMTGELAGYHISFVVPHLHYKSTLLAITDIFYLRKEHRQGANGIALFMFFEREMKRRGVKEIMAGTKLRLNLGKMFERMGWIESDHLYAKWIGD